MSWQVQVFYDGLCPLCAREISMLRRLDRGRNKIAFTDIAAADFSPEAYGTTLASLMERIRGRLPDGSWIEGVEVFRRLYGAVGFGFLVPLTRLPGVRSLLDLAYEIFAKNRLKWTGRCDANGQCALPPSSTRA
jgi:predicted DCC family thiol-disulfide oxidoreductase YuxK